MTFNSFAIIVFVASLFSLVAIHKAEGQTESLEGVQFTPPAGWSRSSKEGVVIFTDSNKTTGHFCILSLYRSVPSSGSPQKDFANRWNDIVVKPFKAEPNPETQTKTEDGWTAIAGGAPIDADGTKAVAVMTVYSGFGKVIALFALLNDESYIPKIDAFNSAVKLDKTSLTKPVTADSAEFLSFDPFPDQPNYQPQKPLTGRLKKSVTMADLAGKWEYGAASVESYYSSSTGNYSGTNTVFFAGSYTISPNGTFEKTFVGRANNHTIREKDSGTVTLSGNFVILDFNGRITYKYQLISYMLDTKGGAVLSLIEIGAKEPGLDPDRLRINCGHSRGYISCAGGEEWVRRPTN